MDKSAMRIRWHLMTLSAMLLIFPFATAQNKWVWSGNGRSVGDNGSPPYYPDEVARPFYRPGVNNYRPPAPVFETTDFTNPPPLLQPSRPVSRPPNNYRPIDGPLPEGPGIITGPDGPRPGGGNRGPGILTGPVPSWEQRPGDKFGYKDYEHCKCAFAFNCASPGIKFGQCDAGKQYCCYNSKPNVNGGPPHINRGPGGGYDINRGPGGGYGDSSVRPTYDRPILVGPGGPTGIISEGDRPFKPSGGIYRPVGREEFEGDYRPNGRPYQGYGTINDDRFPRPPYDPYARNANIEAKKNGKKL